MRHQLCEDDDGDGDKASWETLQPNLLLHFFIFAEEEEKDNKISTICDRYER